MNDAVKQGEAIQAQIVQRETDQAATAAQATSAAQGASVAKPEPATAPSGDRTQAPAHSPADGGTASHSAEEAAAGATNAESVVPAVPADTEENSEFAELQRAVAAGKDISKDLDPTAAGQGGGGGESIGDAVRFERGLDARDPTAGFDPDITPPPLITPTANSTLVEEPVAPPPDNGVQIGGLTGAADGGDVTVREPNLADGSSPNAAALTQTGTFTISAPDGIGSLTIGGVEVLNAGGLTGNPVTTPLGNTLIVTGYDAVTGIVTYAYTLLDNEGHPAGQGANDLFDSLPITLTDSDGDTTTDTLAVRIVDDLPHAVSDIDEVGTGGATGGNVFTGTDDDALDRVQSDVQGADRTAAPITGVVAGEHLDSPLTDGTGVGSVVQGIFGTLILNTDGSYVYTANGGLASDQTEIFTYTLTDADGDTSTATLTIEIRGEAPPPPPPPPPPVNVLSDGNEVVSALEDTLVTGNVLANTVNPDGPFAASVTQFSVAGDPIVYAPGSTVTIAGVGELVVHADGSFTFNPAGGFNGPVPLVTYTVTDGAATDVSTLSISVDPVNDVPVANPDTNWAKEDTADASGNVLLNLPHSGAPTGTFADVADTDVDLDALTVTGHTGGDVYGTLTLNADGSYNYVLDNTNVAVQGLSEGETLTETYSYTVTDGAAPRTATLTITIFGTNDGVTITGIGNSAGDETVNENDLLAGSSPSDPDLTQMGSFTIVALDGIASIDVGGTPLTLAELQTAATFPVVINTPYGALTLTGFSGDAQGGVVSYSYTLDTAVDNDTQLGAVDAGFVETLLVTVTDEDGSSASSSLNINIVDDEPSATDDTDSIVAGSLGPADGNVMTGSGGSDTNGTDGVIDTKGADGAQVTAIASTNVPANTDNVADGSGNFSVTGQYGVLTLNQDGSYSYARNAGSPGGVSDVFTYTLTDGDGDTDTATLTISIGNDVPTGGISAATVDDDGLAGGNPLSTSGDINANAGEVPLSASEAIYNGTLAFTSGGDTPVSIGFAGMHDLTGAVGTETVTYGWSVGTNTLTATITGGARGGTALFNVVVTNPATGAYALTLLDNVLHAAGGAEVSAPLVGLTYRITDNDGSTANGTLNVTFNDDAASARDFSGIIVDTTGQSLSSLIDYNLGADGFGGMALRFDGATSSSSAFTGLKSQGAVVSTAVIDGNGDGLQELVGFVETAGGPAGYDIGDRLVFTLAPTTAEAASGGYALTLSDVLDLPREPINLSFSGISASGPVPTLAVGSSLLISAVTPGDNVNASSNYIGINSNVMDVGETVKYSFGTIVGGAIPTGNEIFVNSLKLDIFQVGGNGNDLISYTVTNTLTNQTAAGTLAIPGAGGLTGPITASFDFNQITFTVNERPESGDDFKVGGIQYTQLGQAADILMNFSYTASDGDADAVSGSFTVTVTDDLVLTHLVGSGDLATITGIGDPLPV